MKQPSKQKQAYNPEMNALTVEMKGGELSREQNGNTKGNFKGKSGLRITASEVLWMMSFFQFQE